MLLFISYARENKDKVGEISPVLAAGGHMVWFDENLLPGQDYKPELAKQIARCDGFVYAATKWSVRSEWCDWELGTAVHLEKAVIPVLLEPDVSLPAPLQKLQCADFSKGVTPIEVAKLMNALGTLQKIPTEDAPPMPTNPNGVPSRAWDTFNRVVDVVTPPLYERTEAEEVIEKYIAGRIVGIDVNQGRLTLTNRRVMFEITGFAFRRLASVAIQLSDIESVVASNQLGLVPIVTIRCQSGKKYKFSFGRANRDRFMASVEKQLKRVRLIT
jgi:hypothetical protein